MTILFLCSGNSARSQMAEAIFNHRCGDDHIAYSAGSHPASQVKSHALRVLHGYGIETDNLYPKNMTDFFDKDIDILITLCDKVKEHCPTYPSKPIYAHFHTPSPSAEGTTEDALVLGFEKTYRHLSKKIDLLLYQLKNRHSQTDLSAELHQITLQ